MEDNNLSDEEMEALRIISLELNEALKCISMAAKDLSDSMSEFVFNIANDLKAITVNREYNLPPLSNN